MIKLFLSDVDGCLTDGGYLVGPGGEISYKFNTKDWFGMRLLHDTHGVEIGIITAADFDCIEQQIMRPKGISIRWYISGEKNKLNAAKEIVKELGCQWDEVAFIGDDLNDLELLKTVGYPACPNDASVTVKQLVSESDGFVCHNSGGHAVVREFIDYLISLVISNDYE